MNDPFAALQTQNPWPASRPYPTVEMIRHDGGGRELVSREIARRPNCIIVEVGSFLGDSALRWLAASPDVRVICVDPWAGDWWVSHAHARGRQELADRFAEPNGPMNCFLTNVWPFRERVVAMQDYAADALVTLHGLGLVPDIIYFDSDKSGPDIAAAVRLFPDALITGDDWSWSNDQGDYPIRVYVRETARAKGHHVVVRKATWLIQAQSLGLRQHLDNLISGLKDIVRPLYTRWKDMSAAR